MRLVEGQEWWKRVGASLRLEVLPSKDSYTAWLTAQQYARGSVQPTCTHADSGSACRVLRAGIIGPLASDASEPVKLVTREAGMPHLSFAATAGYLTQSPYKPLNPVLLQPFFRVAYKDEMVIGGLWALIKASGWRIFSILHARDELGDASVVGLQDLVQREAGNHAAVWNIASFEPNDVGTIDTALETLRGDTARVIVLFAYSNDAALVMQRATDMGLAGKGWTWLGGEWVRDFTWIASSLQIDYGNTSTAAADTAAPATSAHGGRLRALSASHSGAHKVAVVDSTSAPASSLPTLSSLWSPAVPPAGTSSAYRGAAHRVWNRLAGKPRMFDPGSVKAAGEEHAKPVLTDDRGEPRLHRTPGEDGGRRMANKRVHDFAGYCCGGRGQSRP